jgi:hypothetical protein
VDGNYRYYVEKKYGFNPGKKEDVCEGQPQLYCELLKYAKTVRPATSIDYDLLLSGLNKIGARKEEKNLAVMTATDEVHKVVSVGKADKAAFSDNNTAQVAQEITTQSPQVVSTQQSPDGMAQVLTEKPPEETEAQLENPQLTSKSDIVGNLPNQVEEFGEQNQGGVGTIEDSTVLLSISNTTDQGPQVGELPENTSNNPSNIDPSILNSTQHNTNSDPATLHDIETTTETPVHSAQI